MRIKQASALLFVLMASVVSADTLVMSNGETLKGKIERRDAEYVYFKTSDGDSRVVAIEDVVSSDPDYKRLSPVGAKESPSKKDVSKAPPKKVALPSQAEITEAGKTVKDVFKDEYSKQDAQSRKALAENFLKQAKDPSNDLPTQYVLLTEAANLAADAGDVATLTDAFSRIGEKFAGDTLLFRGGVLARAAKNTKESADQSDIAESFIDLSAEALAAEKLDIAKKAADAASACAVRATVASIINSAKENAARVTETQKAFDLATTARQTLKTNADDAAANLALGRWLCFYKNDWPGGIPLLAKSGDPALAAVATSDTQSPAEAKAQAAVANAWFTLGDKETSEYIKACLWSRAKYWYSKSVRGLGGLLAERTKKRIEQIDALGLAAPGAQKTLTVNLGGGVKMELVRIRPGSFIIGSVKDPQIGSLPHKVTITKPFYIGKYEVTQEQWKAVMGRNLSFYNGDKNPVERVSWDDCQLFVRKLTQKYPGRTFRLPSEAEWEYACRAGSTTEYCYGDDESALGEYAWYDLNSNGTPHEVGQKRPNAWGIYDMHGNVWEWCQDWYAGYPGVDEKDPQGPKEGKGRVVRGGSWLENRPFPQYRSAYRANIGPATREGNFGLRVVMSGAGVE